MSYQPTGAFRHEAAQQENAQAQYAADGEPEAPAPVDRHDGRVEKHQGGAGACDRTEPKAAIDHEIDAAAIVCRYEFVDGRIDGGILAADPDTRDRPECRKAPEIPRCGGEQHAGQIDDQRDIEHEPPAEPVGEPAEDERAAHGSNHVGGGGSSDLLRGQSQRLRILQHRPDRPDDRDLEAIEDPCHTQGDDNQDVKAAPGKSIETRRNIGPDGIAEDEFAPRRLPRRVGLGRSCHGIVRL